MNVELCQVSKMEIFPKVSNDWQPLLYFEKIFILHIGQGFNYTSVVWSIKSEVADSPIDPKSIHDKF